jgi:glucose/arabinose dehydrogenase/PKD repeat protein
MARLAGLIASSLLVLALVAALSAAGPPSGAAATLGPSLPNGFHDQAVVSGLDRPTVFRFAPNGTIFVGEQGGKILELDGLNGTPKVFADLSTEVDAYWDRGLLGLAVDPAYPAKPYVYALYAYDAPPGQAAPVWNDACPTPPGPTTDGCVVQGRLVRLTADASTGDLVPGSEKVLIQDWCQQFPSHSVGDLGFGADGELYASGGEGASFLTGDYGQLGGSSGSPTPVNPCGDPPNEGGSLRAQSLRRTDGPAVLGGSVIRVDPATGDGVPGNPDYSSADPSSDRSRIVAYGLRNPFRFVFRPGTDDLWIGDVGEYVEEEVDHLPDPTPAAPGLATNFGWPCQEGPFSHGAYMALGLPLCADVTQIPTDQTPTLPTQVTAPYFSYNHSADLVDGGSCSSANGSSITGVAFYEGTDFPASYDGALLFADHTRNCIWAMLPDSNGAPDPANVQLLDSRAGNPVDLEAGPDGDIYYADLEGGAIHRISYATPTAVANADHTDGAAPLTVQFDGSGSSAPDGNSLTYSWDFGDGSATDPSQSPTHTFTQPGTYTVRLTVTDDTDTTDVSAPITISAGNTPPVPVIDTPSTSLTWKVGQPISYSGHATDAQDPSSDIALSWAFILHHCITPSNCHTHLIETDTGASGTVAAPDHPYPSYLELQLTATDSGGLSGTTSIRLDPQVAPITVDSNPSGATIYVDGQPETTPFTGDEIVNSTLTLQAVSPQTISGQSMTFATWSDAGAASHTTTTPSSAATYTVTFSAPAPAPPSGGGGGGGGGGGYPDLGVGLTADSTQVAPGATVRLEATVANTGLGGSTGDSFSLGLPAGVVPTLAKSDRGPGCVMGSSSIDCDLDFTSSGQAAHVIMLLEFPTAGTFTIGGTAFSGFPADPNLANNSATLTVVVGTPAPPHLPPPPSPAAKPTFSLVALGGHTRAPQIVRRSRYVEVKLAATVGNATTIGLDAQRQVAGQLRTVSLAVGTSIGGVTLHKAATVVVARVGSTGRVSVSARIERGSTRGLLRLRFAVTGRGGRRVFTVPLSVVG